MKLINIIVWSLTDREIALKTALSLLREEIEKMKKPDNPIHTPRQAARVKIYNSAITDILKKVRDEK